MTEGEAKGFIQGKLDCMNKCGVFNKEDNIRDNDCDNCEYCYSQGNFGEQKEAFQMALQALEKQVPNKPIRNDKCTCPSCGTHNDVFKRRRNTVAHDIVYCWHCGQAVEIDRLE